MKGRVVELEAFSVLKLQFGDEADSQCIVIGD